MSVKKLGPGVPSGLALPGWTSWKGILGGQGGGSCRWSGGRDIFRGGWKAGILAHPQLAGASLQCGAGGCAARGAQGTGGWRGARGHRFLRFARVGDRGLSGHHVRGVGERRRTHFSASGTPPLTHVKERPQTPRSPHPTLGPQPSPTSGSPGLTWGAAAVEVCPGLVWSVKNGGEGLAEVLGRRMGQRVLTGIGGDAVSYPPPDFWAPAHESLQSRGAVDDVRLGRPLHLPPIPPGSRRVPFKCPGAGARAAAGAAAAAAPGPTAVPARHKRLSNHSGAGAHQRGGPLAGHASRLSRRLPERERRWGCAQAERRAGAHPCGGAWVGGTLAGAAAGLCVSPRPHTQKWQGCASRALSPEICRNAPLPPAPMPFLAPKPRGRHRWTQPRKSSSSPTCA